MLFFAVSGNSGADETSVADFQKDENRLLHKLHVELHVIILIIIID